ncbi:MAG: cob(I)yrinic acid a,c-diamide adenosyltransferase [Holophaga sp.]|nr:cob(I)yrinic acid a,c-diamide adenosyltransferase [Holophaga sp.]
MSRLYTRTGDEGTTGLFGGRRVTKSHTRLEAYGTVDELNSVIGVLRLHVSEASGARERLPEIQNDLFVIGAVLATPSEQLSKLGAKMTRPTWEIAAMEGDIDRLSALAPPMVNFVLPGGGPASAYAHLARTVCRRAEREAVALAAEDSVSPLVLTYLNRLSDWLFALSRAENALSGVGDVEWVPKG